MYIIYLCRLFNYLFSIYIFIYQLHGVEKVTGRKFKKVVHCLIKFENHCSRVSEGRRE